MFIQQHPPHVSMLKRRKLSVNELQKILSIAKRNPRLQDLYDVVSLISNTGIRLNELKSLSWADVDFGNSRFVIVSPMSTCARYVPFESKTFQILEARRFRNPASEFVFGDTATTLLNRVVRQLRDVGNKIGVSPVSMHILRHTFFSRLMGAGADPLTLMFIGGWRNPSFPFKMSFFPTPEQKCDMAVRYLKQVEEELYTIVLLKAVETA